MSKNYFFGKYYKFISSDGFLFAIIDSYSDDGKEKQIITPDGGYSVKNPDSIRIDGKRVDINISQEGLEMRGTIIMGEFSPLKSNAMGPFKLFSMECAHDIYSMRHSLSGEITVNGRNYSFENGFGYIEGDKGKSFPENYFWYNSVGEDYSVTVAVATIPLGFIKFTGLLTFIHYRGKEYRLCTYNFARAEKLSEKGVTIKKGKYKLTVSIHGRIGGHNLKAPKNGKMGRLIKENIAVKSSFTFTFENNVILEKEDDISSVEYMIGNEQ